MNSPHARRRSKALIWLLIGMGLVSGALPLARAIDPLPPEIESAPLAVRSAYRDRMARESLEEKIAVGARRYEQRMEVKANIGYQMEQQAMERLAYYHVPGRRPSTATAMAMDEAEDFLPGVAIVLIMLIVYGVRHFTMPNGLDRMPAR